MLEIADFLALRFNLSKLSKSREELPEYENDKYFFLTINTVWKKIVLLTKTIHIKLSFFLRI